MERKFFFIYREYFVNTKTCRIENLPDEEKSKIFGYQPRVHTQTPWQRKQEHRGRRRIGIFDGANKRYAPLFHYPGGGAHYRAKDRFGPTGEGGDDARKHFLRMTQYMRFPAPTTDDDDDDDAPILHLFFPSSPSFSSFYFYLNPLAERKEEEEED